MNVVHSRKLRVALGDVDAARVIYFPAVFRWHEYNFSEWLALRYKPLSELLASGFGLPVVNCSATYTTSIRQDDVVRLDSWVADVGESSFTFGTSVLSGDDTASTVETRHVWVKIAHDGTFASAGLPPELRGEMAG
ncbi:acyl-CoA thioesterase [Arthrobacter sp. 49Tsu3.1M3]|uniref:acyl-CoA thioesterase n=1 Tax=Arthrobacter sp. 49Tsu3.1M3 TaxID=1279029 RepID=UPI0015C49211|nr:thioesterase family protein [Arthrobacter sp. 49Tsu3.1M3]